MGNMLLALAVLAGNYVFLAVAFLMTVLPHLRHIGGVPALLGSPFPMPAVCLCSDLTPLFGTVLSLGVGFGGGVHQVHSSLTFMLEWIVAEVVVEAAVVVEVEVEAEAEVEFQVVAGVKVGSQLQ